MLMTFLFDLLCIKSHVPSGSLSQQSLRVIQASISLAAANSEALPIWKLLHSIWSAFYVVYLNWSHIFQVPEGPFPLPGFRKKPCVDSQSGLHTITYIFLMQYHHVGYLIYKIPSAVCSLNSRTELAVWLEQEHSMNAQPSLQFPLVA